jgi:hypothetical protein
VSLCRAHHRLVHEGGIVVEALAGGGWRFRRPDGREYVPAYCKPEQVYEWTALRETHLARRIAIDARTAATRWTGERMDYGLGVWLLCAQVERARRVAAGLDTPWDADVPDESTDVPAETSEECAGTWEDGGVSHAIPSPNPTVYASHA